MRVGNESFQQLCGNTVNYLKAAYQANKKVDIRTEQVQLEEAYTDFRDASRIETPQEVAQNLTRIALEDSQNRRDFCDYLYGKTVAMYGRIQRGEKPQLPHLNGEGGMLSFPVPTINLNI